MDQATQLNSTYNCFLAYSRTLQQNDPDKSYHSLHHIRSIYHIIYPRPNKRFRNDILQFPN